MLRFDVNRLIDDVKKIIDKKLDEVAQKAVEFMIYEIASLPDSGSHDSVGASEWRRDVINAIKFIGKVEGLEIIKQIGLIDVDELTLQRGLLISYGMGNALAQDNPYLQEYLSSEYYDPARDGYGVYTRPGDMVFDYETGGWKPSTAKNRYEITNFWQNPSYFFDNAMRLIRSDFDRVIEEIGDSIDFATYLVVK
jgi:hypothetical protein